MPEEIESKIALRVESLLNSLQDKERFIVREIKD
jgi:hypothetical protein